MGGKGSKGGGGEQQQESRETQAASGTSAEQTAVEAGKEQVTEKETAGTEYMECTVAKVSDFGANEMREVEVGEGKALLVHQNGVWSAVGAKCTHYGAPLSKGCLGNGRVRCPWHGACFNITSGDIEDFPGLDSLPRFQVRVEEDDVIIKADKNALENTRRTKGSVLAAFDEDKRTFLIVGGGPASVVAAETLRQEGFKGRVILATRENVLPYDRPKLSKALNVSPESIQLRSADFYSSHDIEVVLGKEAVGVDKEGKKVKFSDGEEIRYDKLLLATGSKPRTLPVPGFQDHVLLLRDPAQANAIATMAEGKKVVVIGTSFIGMEVAAYLCGKAAGIACIDITTVPFERVLGARIGKMLQEMLEEKGVEFHLNAGVKEIVQEEGKVTGVMLPSGETLPCEVVIAGVGVVPATDFLKESGLPMSSRGEVVVNGNMCVEGDVYAAGDIARFPLPLIGDSTSIGHWQLSHNHGRVAARNMMGKEETFSSVPFFWTVLFGKSLRYCGHALSWDDIIYNGEPEERKFSAFFVKDDKVLAVCSLNSDPVVAQAAELMYQGKMPSGSQLKEDPKLSSHL